MRCWRRVRLAFLGGVLALAALASSAAADDAQLAADLRAAFDAGALTGLHAVVAERDGARIVDAYFPGLDETWGRPLGVRDHGPETLHDVRSVTKSVVSLLYGIALSEGLVPPLDAPLVDQFPEYADLAADPERRAILIQHALTMQMGIEWNEELPYTDPNNSEIAMERAPDRYRFVLEQPMRHAPGDVWIYNGGATAVIAELIARGAGVSIDAFARTRLFEPLGIARYEWIRGPDGTPSAASGLRLTAPDLLKIGQLIVADGVWDGRRLVPSEWIAASFAPSAKTSSSWRYGYFWWVGPEGSPPGFGGAFGNGGQRLSVNPESGAIVVILAGNYNQPEAWRLPVTVIEEFLVPAFRRHAEQSP